jgi:predicted transcriptional regulator
MGREKLRQVLEELHFELLKLGPQEESLQRKADDLATDLRDLLDEPDLGDVHASVEELLADSATSFEAAHPRIAELISRVLTMLSSMGL